VRFLILAILILSSCTHNPAPTPPWPNPTPPPAPPPPAKIDNGFLINTNAQVFTDLAAMQRQNHPETSRMAYVAAHTVSSWHLGTDTSAIAQRAAAAKASGSTAVLVLYNIPHRDCGNAGLNAQAYRQWMAGVAAAIGQAKAIVILEPDAISMVDCLSQPLAAERYSLLSGAVTTLKRNVNTKVYLDGGHSAWHSAEDETQRLVSANIQAADGFSINVSNYRSLEELLPYGQAIAEFVGKNFIVDTSRNGIAPADNTWCNARGRALGQPNKAKPDANVDAYLWIKPPGESDGTCNGGPAAGVWWRAIALELARNAGH